VPALQLRVVGQSQAERMTLGSESLFAYLFRGFLDVLRRVTAPCCDGRVALGSDWVAVLLAEIRSLPEAPIQRRV
jgi:hypothetical protein